MQTISFLNFFKFQKINLMAVVLFIVASTFFSVALAEEFKEGTDYTRLDKPTRVDNPDKIEVREFFWYGCPHCYKMESFLRPWIESKPDDVDFVLTPGVLNRKWEIQAKGYYVAKSLGLVEKTHRALFDAIHKEKQPLDTKKSLANFYQAYGVDKKTFNKLYDSFDVATEIRQADALARVYRLMGVPAVVVNGKYVTTAKQAKSYERWIKIIDHLIEIERQVKKN